MTDRGSHLIFEWLKAKLLIPPVIAIGFSAAWLGSLQRSISTLEQQNSSWQKAITARSSGSLANSSAEKSTSATETRKDDEPLDWKKISKEFEEHQTFGGTIGMRNVIDILDRSHLMTKEELIAGLNEIATLDIDIRSRDALEKILIRQLLQKDPEFVLRKYIDRIQEPKPKLRTELSEAMLEWAKKDSVGAIAWFDEQIAAGTFDSKSLDGESRARHEFESNLISLLVDVDFNAVKNRLNALPENQREKALSKVQFESLNEENQMAFADLVRITMPRKDQAEVLSQHVSSLARGEGGYEKISAYLKRIRATPHERTACIDQAVETRFLTISNMNKITREDVDTMREWVTSQAPESTAAMTGKGLALAIDMGDIHFSEAAQLALAYHSTSGNDGVLSSFLRGGAIYANREQARHLAEKIADPKVRAEILNQLK